MIKQPNFIKSDLKLELISYFDAVQFEIDTHAQLALSSLKENEEEKRQKVLSLNEEMISLVKEALESNITRINEYEFENDSKIDDEKMFKEDIKKNLIKSDCFYAKKVTGDQNSLGFLLLTDWYLDEKQLKLLKTKIKTEKYNENLNDDGVFHLNSDGFNIFYKLFMGDLNYQNGTIMRMRKEKIIFDLQNIEELNIRFDYNFNWHFEPNLFQNLKNLKSLCIQKLNGSYTNIKISDFDENCLQRLESLRLDCSSIILRPKILCKIPNLKTINLKGCYLSQEMLEGLNLESFFIFVKNQKFLEMIRGNNSLINLKSLEITCFKDNLNEKLELNNETFGHLKQLETLRITCYKIEIAFDFAFANLKNLRELFIYSLEAKIISKNGFVGLNFLKILSIVAHNKYIDEHCVIDHIENSMIEDNAFSDLIHLKYLKLSLKNLSKVNRNIFKNLLNLETLYIYACCIQEITHEAFNSLKNLKELNIHIPGHEEYEKYLKYLVLKNNTFANQEQLEILTVDINGLEEIEDNAFKGLVNLKQLNIKSMNLKKLTNNILKHMTNLEKLWINDQVYNTRIVDLIIEGDTFHSLSNLKSLTLNANKLPSINENLFKNLINLEIIKICVENIDNIYRNILNNDALKNLKIFSLKKMSNPFQFLRNKDLEGSDIKIYLGLLHNNDVQLEIRNDITDFFLKIKTVNN